MFWHSYKYRLKATLHEKEEVFWNFFFPILLCTCFAIAFSSINNKAYLFHSIPVAVVYEQDNEVFKQTITSVGEDDSEGEAFLKISEVSADEADKLLADGDVDAVITVSDSIHMTVTKEGLNQTAVQTFLDQYLQTASVFENVMSTNPEAVKDLTATLSDSVSYIKESSFTKGSVDPLASYYFSLIGMAILFGGFFGLQCAVQMKADMSPEGMRKCLAPIKRGSLIISEFLATFTIHILSLMALLLYMIFILRIDLGGQFGYIALTCAVGSIFGISLGTFIGSIPRLKEAGRTTIFICFSLGSSFLSGLMVADLKIYLQQHAPIVNKINPATLIQDALYSLLIYDTHTRYYSNMITLGIYAVVLFAVSYFMTRRESYASI